MTRLLQFTDEIFLSNKSHSKSGDVVAPSEDRAIQCDIDRDHFHRQLSLLQEENEMLKKELSLQISTIKKRENENALLITKKTQIETEIKLMKNRDSITWEFFKKMYPEDNFKCLTKRMETELYLRNMDIKELSDKNDDLKNELNTLQSIIEMQQREM